MRAICFIQEVKSGDLTMRQQILICRKALRKLRWPCVQEGLIASLLCYGIHTFGVKCGWIEPGGRHWMALPNYDSEV